MDTIRYIKQLDVTNIVTDKTDQQQAQTTIKLTNKAKLDTLGRVERVHNDMMRIASIERAKEKKQAFYKWNKTDNSLKPLPINKSFLLETVSWYQTADYLFNNKLLKI